MAKKETNPQAQATLEIAKGLFTIADTLKAKGATLPPIAETTPMANALDGALIEVAKGVHQVAQGVETLPASTEQSSPTASPNAPLIWRGTLNVPADKQTQYDISMAIPEMFINRGVIVLIRKNFGGWSTYHTHFRNPSTIRLAQGNMYDAIRQIDVVLTSIDFEQSPATDMGNQATYEKPEVIMY